MGIWLHWSTSNHQHCWPVPKIPWRLGPEEIFITKIFMKILPWIFCLHNNSAYFQYGLVVEKMVPLFNGNFLQYISLWFLMATIFGFSRSNYWSSKDFYKRENLHPSNFSTFISRGGLTPSTTNYASLPNLHQTTMIEFGRSTRWLEHGTNTWLLCLLPVGSFAWTKACPFGTAC